MLAKADAFLDALNAAVPQAVSLRPRVRFDCEVGEVPERWLKKKHAGGAVHEPATIAAFLAAAQAFSPAVVFDVGALYGYFAILARQIMPAADIVAFEMHPGAWPILMRNLAGIAGGVKAAVADRHAPGTRVWINGFNIFEEPAGGWDKLAEVPGAMKDRGADNRGRGFAKIDFITLDDFVAAHGLVPGLVKIDVEGYQAKAVQGAQTLLATHRPAVIIELHDPAKLARFGTSNRATVAPFYAAGYRGYWCGNHRAPDARFEAVDAMGEQHEKLSIMVFVPGERL